MDYEFDWHGTQGYLDDETKTEIEKQIKKDIEEESEFNEKFRPCHPNSGPVKIHLTYRLLPSSGYAGNVNCACGKLYLKFEGKEINKGAYEGSYDPVEKQ